MALESTTEAVKRPLSAVNAAIRQPFRRLPWWVSPVITTVVLVGFGIYTAIVALFFRGEYESYLSPFFSPPIGAPSWLPDFFYPGVLVLWLPLGFRATCYYYRKAYYRSFFWDPPACSSKAQQREFRSAEGYRGERNLFVWNNILRYFLYGSFVLLTFLTIDAVRTFFPPGEGFAIHVGSIIFTVNVALLWSYSFSCHSLRHIVGGRVDCYSCVTGSNYRLKAYNWLTVLNRQHALWAWLNLFWLLITDIYLRLVMAGLVTDFRLVG